MPVVLGHMGKGSSIPPPHVVSKINAFLWELRLALFLLCENELRFSSTGLYVIYILFEIVSFILPVSRQ